MLFFEESEKNPKRMSTIFGILYYAKMLKEFWCFKESERIVKFVTLILKEFKRISMNFGVLLKQLERN